jgi:sugar phosphate isomerase/epimerase
MKLSIDSFEMCERYGDFKAVEMIKEAGFDALDYTFCCRGEDLEIFGNNYIEYAKKLRKHIDYNGLVCNQAHAPLGLSLALEPEKYKAKFQKIVRSIEAAAILGAKTIVVHSQGVPDNSDIDPVEYNIEYYKSLIPYCEKFGICVAMENLARIHPKSGHWCGVFPSTPEAMKEAIVERIGSPWIVACVDVGHATLMGIDPEKFLAEMDGSYLKALHVHDADYVDDRHSLPFTWEINWEAVMKTLKKIGYEGDLTFEILEFLKKFPEPLFLEALKLAQKVGRHLISIFDAA